MTPNELLALLGRAWSRLLIFPGGLTAFAAVWLIARIQNREPKIEDREWGMEDSAFSTRDAILYPLSSILPRWFMIIGALVPPWLGLALLPLPPAPGLSRQTDLVVILALLEWPLALAIAHDLRAADAAGRLSGLRRLAAALNGYPPRILAALALAQASGSFEVAALSHMPGALAPAFAAPLHWIGAVAWTLALPPALGLGPFASESGQIATQWERSANGANEREEYAFIFAFIRAIRGFLAGVLRDDPIRTGLRLRALGLVLLAALPWMAAAGALDEGGLRTIGGVAAWLLSPLAIAALLWGYDRLAAGRSAWRWARIYLILDVALLLALLWAAYAALQARLA